MKHLLLSLISLLFLHTAGNAQGLQYHWMNQLGGTSTDAGGYVTVDNKGNVYTASVIFSTAFFKPYSPKKIEFTKTTSATSSNLVITKVDAVGNLIWSKQIGADIIPTTSFTDNHNNLVIAGSYYNTVDFDPGVGVFNLTAKAESDIFVLKLDENGDFLWAGSIGSKKSEQPYSIVTDKNDNIALICEFRDTIDVDISSSIYNLIPTSPFEKAVIKLSPTGSLLWAHHLKDINPNVLGFDTSGNLYTSGFFLTTKDFDFGSGTFNMTSTGSAASSDVYLLKEDTAGKFLWAKSFGEFINKDAPTAIAVDKRDNVIIAGNCGGGNSDFDPGAGVVNLVGNNAFILKLDKSGNYVWAKGINGGTAPFNLNAIGVDDSNKAYFFGHFNVSVDFDPGLGTSILSPLASRDGFLLQLDSNGLFNWVYQLKCTSVLYASSMHVSATGNLYLGGYFNLKTDFDPGLGTKIDSSVGNADVFTLKLSHCLLNNSISLNECKYFDYAGHRFDSSELVDVLFVTAAGCDSVVTVDMMVKTVNDTISAAGSVISAKSTTATSYQWVNCPSYSAIPGATSASFTASTTGNYALIVSENGCTDTSDCTNVIGLGIKDATNGLAVSVYPNPSKDVFHLQFAQSTQATVEIRSMEGRLLQQLTIDGTEKEITLTGLSSGVYFLNITTQDGVQKTEKLLKY